MDIATMAEIDGAMFSNPRMVALHAILEESEASRASSRLKWLLTKSVLTGTTYDRGTAPYQDFESLFMLRDAIVHLKPEGAKERNRILTRLKGLGILAEPPPNHTVSWLGQIGTRAAARWACNVVADMVDSLVADLGGLAGNAPLTTSMVTNRFKRLE